MSKTELPASQGTEAFDETVRKITESVRAQHEQLIEANGTRKGYQGNMDQIDRFKNLARELGCDEDEAVFDAALKRLSDASPLPKHQPKKRSAPKQ